MAEPGYEHENIFGRVGRAIFGSPEKDVKPGRDQPSPYGDTKGKEVVVPNPLPPNYRAEPPAAIETKPPSIHGAASAAPSPNLNAPRNDAVRGTPQPPQPPPWQRDAGDPDAQRVQDAMMGIPANNTPPGRPAPPGPDTVDRAGAAGLNVGDPHPPQQTEPTPVQSDDEASFRPGPLPKKPGAPGGGGAGGGRGAGAGGWKKLGDQSRTEAYDPTKDRADPRNIAIVDESGKGRVNPRQWERAQKGAIDPTKPGERTGEAAAKYTNHYTAALEGATNYMAEMFHQKKGDPNQGEGYMAMTFKGMGAPDPKVVAGVFNVVDPKNELEPKERMELATRAMHDWYTAKGDKKGADQVAAEMLQYGNKQAQTFGNQALQAMKAGNKDAAVGAIKQAYDWLPDGFHADVQQGKLTITNDKGKVVNSFPLDDKTIANLGTGLATGTLFWDVVQDRAGKPGTFAPPQGQPTQAIAATAPTGPPAGSPPATAQAPPPAPQAPPQGPAGAGPPPAATPSGPPVVSPGPPRPPGPPPAPAPPGAAPGSVPPPPPQVTPPSTRPAAPAPAAPGPTQPQQAAPIPLPKPEIAGPQYNVPPDGTVTAQAPVTPAQGGGEPEPKPALDTSVPPPLKGPVQPTTTKRPIVAGEPEKKPAEPAPVTPGSQPAKPAETKTEEKKPAETKQEPRWKWNKDDPDKPPVDKEGRERTHRKRGDPELTPQVMKAIEARKAINKRYDEDKDFVFTETSKSTSAAYTKKVAAMKQTIDAKYQADMKEINKTIDDWKAQQKQADADEKKALEPKRFSVSEAEKKGGEVNTVLTALHEKKDPILAASPFRKGMMDDEKKWAPVRDAALEIHAHNKEIPVEKIVHNIITMTSHLGSDEAGKGQKANDGEGENASRFRVIGKDLRGNYVVAVGVGDKAVELHMPKTTLMDLNRMKKESYRTLDKERQEDLNKYTSRQKLKTDAAKLFGLEKQKGKTVDKVIDWAIGPKPRDKL